MLKSGKKNSRVSRIETAKSGRLYRPEAENSGDLTPFSQNFQSPNDVCSSDLPIADNELFATTTNSIPPKSPSDGTTVPSEATDSASGQSRSRLVLDFNSTTSRGRFAGKSSEYAAIEEDWVLLDCCFGIPLFDAVANRQVCRRIAMQKLCHRDKYVYIANICCLFRFFL